MTLREETVKQRTMRRLSKAGRYWRAPYESLTPAEKVLRTVIELDAEVNNGQYFFNGTGDLCREAPAAFRAIGAEATAELIERALAVFPGDGPSPHRDERIPQLEGLPAENALSLRALDDDYYKKPDDIENLLFWYVRSHTSEIQGAE